MKRAIDETKYQSAYCSDCMSSLCENTDECFGKAWESLEPCLTLSDIEAVLDSLTIKECHTMDVQYNAAINDIRQAIREKLKGEKE